MRLLSYDLDARQEVNMESVESPKTLGTVLDECLADAKADWLANYKAGRDEESAWTLDIVEASLTVQLKHGGLASVQVAVCAKRPWQSQISFFRIARKSANRWQRVRDTLGLYRK